MADTTFTAKVTKILASWLNDANRRIYKDSISVKSDPYSATGDGVTDDTAAIDAAYAACPTGGTLFFPTGTYLRTTTLVISKKIRVVFAGGKGSGASDKPSSYILKKSTMTTLAIQITATDVVIEGGGVVSSTGATGGGVSIEANGISLRDFSAIGVSSDGVGIRVGKDAGGDNANSWVLDNCNSCGWGSHGIYIHDNAGGAANANAGTASYCQALSNGGDGIRCDNAGLNTFIGCLGETNTGNGFTMGNTNARSATNNQCSGNNVLGGDYEANTAGQFVLRNSSNKCGYQLSSGITITDSGFANANIGNNLGGRTSYTPGLVGSTGTDKSITATSLVGTVCTATSAAHGYSNGDSIWIRGCTNGNLNGVFVISNITANTFDFTVRTDVTFNTPSVSDSGTARKGGVYTTAVGAYEYDKNKVFFQAYIVTSALTGITGTVQLVLPVATANIGANSFGTVTLDYYSGITHAGKLDVLVTELGSVNQNFWDTIGSGLSPAQLNVSGLAAVTTIVVSGWYFWQ